MKKEASVQRATDSVDGMTGDGDGASVSKTGTRGNLLDQAALEAARSWTRAYCAELAREGRRVEGGWPGTIREARTRAAVEAARVLSKESMVALTHDELDRLARSTYDEARRSWGRKAR